MAFSYSLFLVLLLIFPGLCFWAGWRSGERTDFLTPSPDKPNSTATLFMVAFGTLIGHLLGTASFALQSFLCEQTRACARVSFDPNIYRALLKGAAGAQGASDIALEAWLLAMLGIGILAGVVARYLAQVDMVRRHTDPAAFGWLNPAVQAVKEGDSFVVAYVVTKSGNDGLNIGYEGIVQQLALDEDQSIKLVVLNDVDRFVVKVSEAGIERIDTASSPIAQLQIPAGEIANVALEVVRAPSSDVAAIAQEDSGT